MKRRHAAAAAALMLLPVAHGLAGQAYYGVVDSYADGSVTIRTTGHSTGHWQVDRASHLNGGPSPGDWVYADVDGSGHVDTLRIEEHPIGHTGVVWQVHGGTLTVRSGNGLETWNMVETTTVSGVDRSLFAVGDEVALRGYSNHNLADVRLIKRGVPLR
ncbi:MAG: hypothetical protein P4L83_02855 [Nevskia sp.]|nr:hypothetical protein [Nevskia sp.]